MGSEKYLKNRTTKKRKKTIDQLPRAPQQDALEADLLGETDRAISEDNNNQKNTPATPPQD